MKDAQTEMPLQQLYCYHLTQAEYQNHILTLERENEGRIEEFSTTLISFARTCDFGISNRFEEKIKQITRANWAQAVADIKNAPGRKQPEVGDWDISSTEDQVLRLMSANFSNRVLPDAITRALGVESKNAGSHNLNFIATAYEEESVRLGRCEEFALIVQNIATGVILEQFRGNMKLVR